MEFPVLVFAIFGFIGAARLAGRAGFRLLTRGVETFLVSEASRTHAQRGDITALRDADEAIAAARRRRRGALALFIGCVCLLAIPPFTPWTALMYASYLPLWLLSPRRGTP